MTASRNFMIGMHLVRQLEFGLFDLQLHRRAEALEHAQIHTLLGEIRSAVAVAPYPDFNRFANSFSHIFSGGYASGYYSYLWAEVLSADCYAAFTEEKEGALYARSAPERQSLGRSFLRNILSVGSARPTLESFRAFLGRDPSIDALLRLFGLASEGSSQGPPLPAQ
jgi:oligopeptidase A